MSRSCATAPGVFWYFFPPEKVHRPEPGLPFPGPLTRLLEPHYFRTAAPQRNGTEPVLPFLYPLTRLVEPHYFRTAAPYRNATEPVLPFLYPLTRLVEPHYFRTVAPQRNGTEPVLPLSMPANSISGATPFPLCRTLPQRHRAGAEGLAFQSAPRRYDGTYFFVFLRRKKLFRALPAPAPPSTN